MFFRKSCSRTKELFKGLNKASYIEMGPPRSVLVAEGPFFLAKSYIIKNVGRTLVFIIYDYGQVIN